MKEQLTHHLGMNYLYENAKNKILQQTFEQNSLVKN